MRWLSWKVETGFEPAGMGHEAVLFTWHLDSAYSVNRASFPLRLQPCVFHPKASGLLGVTDTSYGFTDREVAQLLQRPRSAKLRHGQVPGESGTLL